MSDNKLPKGITLDILRERWETAIQEYAKPFRRIYILDATDRSKLWEAVKATFPKYQILPDTNHVSYIKNNLLASIYSVGKSAQLLPSTEDDIQTVGDINLLLDHQWHLGRVGYYQMLAGERAALTNLGITQVGWDNNLSGGSGSFAYTGMPVLKNIDPTKFMRDPFSDNLETAAWCLTWDVLHENILRQNPLYKDAIDAAIREADHTTLLPTELMHDRPYDSQALTRKGYHKLVTHWVRDGDKVHEIHTLNSRSILHVKADIKPSVMPFALLYCNTPAGDLIGTSEPARIFANSFAYNLTNSILLTAEYKNQRPPRFISASASLNVASFVAHGNEADYTFVVNGDASKAVHYHQFPLPSAIAPQVMGMLNNDIQQVTGVTDRYTGKSTGSILTTGGMEAALDQATLIDTYKVMNYEEYTVQLTRLILSNMIEFSVKRKYLIKNPKTSGYASVEVDFPALNKAAKESLFTYAVNISTELPKNKARIAQMANVLMEKQMQYSQTGQKVHFITPEEWLMMQDLPNKELMAERMGIQRNADYTEKVSRVLFGYANLVQQGVDPREAIDLVAQDLQAAEVPGSQVPGMMEAPPEEMPPQEPMSPMQGMSPEQMPLT